MDSARQLQQPLHSRQAAVTVFSRADLDRAIDKALLGTVGAIDIAGDIVVRNNDPLALGELTHSLELRCTSAGRFISEAGASLFTMSGSGDGAGAGDLDNRLILKDLCVGGFNTDGSVDFSTCPTTVVALKDEAKDFYLTINGGRLWTGTAAAAGNLILGADNAVVRRSQILNLANCHANINAAFVRSFIIGNNLERVGAITQRAGGSATRIASNVEVKGITITSGSTGNIVSGNIGDIATTAIAATTSDGNTVTSNRLFSGYPTAGGTDVVANNA